MKNYYLISVLIILLAFVLFSFSFENRRPQTREIVLIAVMAALAVAGRTIFFMVPQVKPMAAIVIIAGCGLSPQTGFLVGAMAAFVSNFFFGQGPWTPWQMLSFGLLGLSAGLFFSGRRAYLKNNPVILAAFGGIVTLVLYGLLMDTASALMYMEKPTKRALLALYVSGFPFNLIHAASTVIFLLLLGRPMLRKLERIKRRYGMMR